MYKTRNESRYLLSLREWCLYKEQSNFTNILLMYNDSWKHAINM